VASQRDLRARDAGIIEAGAMAERFHDFKNFWQQNRTLRAGLLMRTADREHAMHFVCVSKKESSLSFET
jgi:hypothetical protein